MRGQWLGKYTGTTDGNVMINIDEVDDHFEAVVYITPSTRDFPVSVSFLSTANKEKDQTATAYVNPIDPRTGNLCKWEDIKGLYQEGMQHSSQAQVNLSARGNKLHVDAVTDIGVSLNVVADKTLGSSESKVAGHKMSWGDFKSHISSIAKLNYLYRGQQQPWSLCTSFHRRGRYRMNEFIFKDVKQLHQRLSGGCPEFCVNGISLLLRHPVFKLDTKPI